MTVTWASGRERRICEDTFLRVLFHDCGRFVFEPAWSSGWFSTFQSFRFSIQCHHSVAIQVMALSALAAVGWARVLIALDFMVVVSILVSALKKGADPMGS